MLSADPAPQRKPRFTFLEVATVVAIIVVLVGLAMWVGGSIHIDTIRSRAIPQLIVIEIALSSYHDEYGCYPQFGAGETPDDAVPLTRDFWDSFRTRSGFDFGQWASRLAPDRTYGFVDLWGNPWWYDGIAATMNPGKYDLWSTGDDGKHGRKGKTPADARTPAANDSDDLTNWQPLRRE